MRGSIICLPMLILFLASPAGALTLYKCVRLDGGGVIYQEEPPSESECLIEMKDLDPDANVIPAEDFIGGRNPGESSDGSIPPPVLPDQTDEQSTVTGQ